MLLSLFIITGFKYEITEKLSGFTAHLSVVPFVPGSTSEGGVVRESEDVYKRQMLSTIHLLASTGVTFQPELHVLTISTKEVPLSFRVFSNALRIAAFALRTLAGV